MEIRFDIDKADWIPDWAKPHLKEQVTIATFGLVQTYFIAHKIKYMQMGQATSSNNISYGPSRNFSLG